MKHILRKELSGGVQYVMRTGNSYVLHEMPLENAEKIIANGAVTVGHLEGFPICVDDKWYFAGEFKTDKTSKSRKNTSEEV